MPVEKYQIVLIEDQKSHAEYITSVLDHDKFDILVLKDGTAALEYLKNPEKNPDLVLVDNILPDMEGIEIIEYFIKGGYDYAFVILTGSNSIDLAVRAMKIGALDYISKSLNLKEELDLVVSKTINLHKERLTKKKLEKQLKEKESQLKEVNATKEKLFSIIAHDLKSPFTSIIGFADLLVKNIHKKDPSNIEFYALNIQSAAKSTFDLLDNLLSWVNSQKGKVSFEPKTIDLSKTGGEITEVLKPTADLKNIKIINNIEQGSAIYADEHMLKTILINLLSNAIKFTNEDGLIKIESNSTKEYLHIAVVDSGVGMDESTIKSLFKLNKAKPKSGTNGEKGSGLGLMVCKDFIDKHEGEIKVESKLGRGSTFTIALPNLN